MAPRASDDGRWTADGIMGGTSTEPAARDDAGAGVGARGVGVGSSGSSPRRVGNGAWRRGITDGRVIVWGFRSSAEDFFVQTLLLLWLDIEW